MKKYLLSVLTFITVFSVISCDKVIFPEKNNIGKLKFSSEVTSSEYVDSKGEKAKVDFNKDEFFFSVMKEKDGEFSLVDGKKWKLKDIPSKIGLPVGDYQLQVASYEGGQKIASDEPYFFGSTSVAISYEEETTASVAVSIADAKFSVIPSDDFNQSFESWSISVNKKSDATKLCELSNTVLEKYIQPTPVELVINAVRRGSKTEWSQKISVDAVNKAEWHKISLNVTAVGSVTVAITVDNTLVEKEIVIGIPNDDEDLGDGGIDNPDPDEPEEFEKPKIEGLNGLDITSVLNVDKSEDIVDGKYKNPVQIKLSAENGGIQKLIVTIDMNKDEDLYGAIQMMFKGNTFDMANADATLTSTLQDIGLIKEGEVIKGKVEYVFDITPFMSMLFPNKHPEGYSFKIEVQDVAGDKANVDFKVKVQE